MSSIFQFSIDTNACNYELWLNDVRIDFQCGNHPLNYNLPINQWLTKDLNKLQIRMLPLTFNQELTEIAALKVTLIQSELAGGKATNARTLKTIVSPDFGELKRKSPGKIDTYMIEEVFKVQISSDIAVDDLQKLNVDYVQVQKVYEKVYGLIVEKNERALIDLMRPKIQHYADAYFVSVREEQDRMQVMIRDIFAKSLQPLNFRGYELRYFLQNKLVCIEDKEGDQPIFFTDDIDSAYTFFPFYFGKRKNSDEWSIYL